MTSFGIGESPVYFLYPGTFLPVPCIVIYNYVPLHPHTSEFQLGFVPGLKMSSSFLMAFDPILCDHFVVALELSDCLLCQLHFLLHVCTLLGRIWS